jgi:hypothetical protein
MKRGRGRPVEYPFAEDLTPYAELEGAERARFKALALARSRCRVPLLETLPEDLILTIAGRDDEGGLQPDPWDVGRYLIECIRHGESAFTGHAGTIAAAMRQATQEQSREHKIRAAFFAMVDRDGHLPTKAALRDAAPLVGILGLPGEHDKKGWARLWAEAGLAMLPGEGTGGRKPQEWESDPMKALS